MTELNAYTREIYVLLLIFQTFGFIPWCVDAEHKGGGFRHFKIGERQVLKCCAANVALLVLIIYSVISEYYFTQDENFMSSSFANNIIAMCSILQRVLPFLLPFLTAMQSKNMIAFFNTWNELQGLFSGHKCSRRKLVLPKLTSVFLPSLSLLFIVILTSAGIVDLTGRLSGFTRMFLIVLTFNIGLQTQVMLIYWWWITCKSLQVASDILLSQYKETVSIGSRASCLHLRKNWLMISKMVSGLGHILSAPLSCLMIYSFGRSLVALFLVIDEPTRAGAFLIGVIVSFSTVKIITTSSHNLQTKVHRNILDAIIFTERMRLDGAAKIEMVEFLRRVAVLLDREISISGYITTGKSLFSTITKSSVTLLICFIQMR